MRKQKARCQAKSQSRRVLVLVKRFLCGDQKTPPIQNVLRPRKQKEDEEEPDFPLQEGISHSKKPLINEETGKPYSIQKLLENDCKLIKRYMFVWRKDGARFYRCGTKQYNREYNDFNALKKELELIESSKHLWTIENMDGGQGYGLVNQKLSYEGKVLETGDGNPLRAKFSNPIKKELVCKDITQSEANIENDDIHQGKKGARFLNGPLQFINHACGKCATHVAGNWTKKLTKGNDNEDDNEGIKQRWLQLLPGIQITVDYSIKQYDKLCTGPYCKEEDWVELYRGQYWKGIEITVEFTFAPKEK